MPNKELTEVLAQLVIYCVQQKDIYPERSHFWASQISELNSGNADGIRSAIHQILYRGQDT